MGYKNDKLDHLDELHVPSSIDSFIKELPDRYIDGNIDRDLERQVEEEWKEFSKETKRKSIKRRVIATTLTVAASFGLFVGSAFVSPTMAKVASKIPYLNSIFESKPLIEEISDALNEKGYKWDGLGVVVQPREVSLMIIGNEEYYQKVKGPVEELIADILKSRDYDAYAVKVTKAPEFEEHEQTPEEKKQLQVMELVQNELEKKYGYNSQAGFVGKDELEIELPKTEKKIAEIKSDLEKTVQEKQLGKISIKVRKYDPVKRERESRWMPIINTISDGLTAKKEYMVDTVGYTNKYKDFTIIISTGLTPSAENAQEIVNKIEHTIGEFLKSEETSKVIEGDSYEIIINGKGDKKLN